MSRSVLTQLNSFSKSFEKETSKGKGREGVREALEGGRRDQNSVKGEESFQRWQ